MFDIIASVIVAGLSCLWGGAVTMVPMLRAVEDEVPNTRARLKVLLLFTYPAGLFLLLHLIGAEFFKTNPLYWMLFVLVYGLIMMGVSGLTVRPRRN